MKHYIYISSTKVEMLFSQIPQNIKSRIATEIKIDLKIFSTTFKDKDANPDTNLYSKLDMVLQHIEADANVGTVACPKSYFRNSMEMKVGEFPNSGLVYFTGKSTDGTVGLGGSLKHVIDNQDIVELKEKPSSLLPRILNSLSRELNAPLQQDLEDFLFPNKSRVLRTVEAAYSRIEGVPLKVEFFAKTLAQEEGRHERVILGTPLYVAYAD